MRKPTNLKHGYRNHLLYYVWRGMKNRCLNKKTPYYYRYGGRGIKVCKEWLDPKTFIEWALANGYAKGLQIDRIDNDGDYEPGNCHFVTNKENSRNRSTVKLNQEKAQQIKDLYAIGNITQKAVGAIFGVSHQIVGHIISGRRWA